MKPALACTLLLLVGTASGCGASTDNINDQGPSQDNPLDASEKAMLERLNERRSEDGLGALSICSVLNASASRHSDDMRDADYLDDLSKDGSTPRERACDEGYEPACMTAGFAEAVASGSEDGPTILAEWLKDDQTRAVLLDAALVVAGTGRSIGGGNAKWTIDLGSEADASCQ